MLNEFNTAVQVYRTFQAVRISKQDLKGQRREEDVGRRDDGWHSVAHCVWVYSCFCSNRMSLITLWIENKDGYISWLKGKIFFRVLQIKQNIVKQGVNELWTICVVVTDLLTVSEDSLEGEVGTGK